MNKLVPILGLGIGAAVMAIVALGLRPTTVSGADDDALWKPFLTAEDFGKLMENEIKTIHDELSKPKPDAHKVKGSAILIALAAQNDKEGDPKQIVMVRDTAMKLFAAADKPNQAKALAEALNKIKSPRVVSQEKTEPVDWTKHIEDLKDAMDIFGLPNKGGEGIERDLITLGQQRKPFSPAQMSDKLVLLAYKSALIAEVAKAHQDQGEKKKKEWLRLGDDMRKYSLELAETAKAKKPKETKTALNKLNTSCNDCHTTFRDK
jgi:gas vesicle protein